MVEVAMMTETDTTTEDTDDHNISDGLVPNHGSHCVWWDLLCCGSRLKQLAGIRCVCDGHDVLITLQH